MQLARVIGTVVSTHKSEKLIGLKFLLCERINPVTMEGLNDFVVAMDGVGTNAGEIVFYVSGSSARFTKVTEGRPADASITAIVDSIEINGQYVYEKHKEAEPE